MFEARTDSVLATRELAAAVAKVVRPGDLLVLTGEMGAGKTAFVQGLGLGLGIDGPITSPTFTLVHEYHGPVTMNHVDVYRIQHGSEVRDLALPELLDGGSITAIEWAT